MDLISDDICPGCDERQARASQLIDYFESTPAPDDAWAEALAAARHFLEDQ